ncbi:hypothetical protein BU25DRAFT_341387 [Macroventuria anomochaeta]|uniref:Uncharacterized protein n=1 Tax=Macroventuria anomochaeta TaxID=301207 RepID=A0ACB6S056_9PLEO|nr:uncharacterized protein BU25DRAFT_341387 [Macroventuria anomochaeta]KAF2627665.1 hypothetical protein BU25DRAFT_341387 [Macroventuria anomochaeta]
MGHAKLLNLHPGMASNPYRSMKEQVPLRTLCELCNRTINTRDWPMHKNSKAHRALEQAGKDKENTKAKNNGTDNWGGETSSFTPDGEFNLASVDSGNDGWGTGGGGGNRACFGCGEIGHTKRDCPKSGASGDRACFACGEVGHTKRDCPKGGSGGAGQACFNCGNEGHRKMDCPEPLKPRAGGGGGGGRACFNCLQPGHNVSECAEPRVERCRNCDAEGHHSRECPQPKDWSRIKCKNCYKYGHGEKRCPEPAGWDTAADSGAAAAGSWDNAGGDSSAAVGGWGGDDVGAGAQETSGGDWADKANAEAQW